MSYMKRFLEDVMVELRENEINQHVLDVAQDMITPKTTPDTRKCEFCGEPISLERLEVLPNTTTCAGCSIEQKRVGYMIGTASKGCAANLVIVPDDKESRRLARRAHLRSR